MQKLAVVLVCTLSAGTLSAPFAAAEVTPPAVSVAPIKAAPGQVLTVTGANCPLDATWDRTKPWKVFVYTVRQDSPNQGAVTAPTTGTTPVAFAPQVGPGYSEARVTPDAKGNWSASLMLPKAGNTANVPATVPGTYAIVATCYATYVEDGMITYTAPLVTVPSPTTTTSRSTTTTSSTGAVGSLFTPAFTG